MRVMSTAPRVAVGCIQRRSCVSFCVFVHTSPLSLVQDERTLYKSISMHLEFHVVCLSCDRLSQVEVGG